MVTFTPGQTTIYDLVRAATEAAAMTNPQQIPASISGQVLQGGGAPPRLRGGVTSWSPGGWVRQPSWIDVPATIPRLQGLLPPIVATPEQQYQHTLAPWLDEARRGVLMQTLTPQGLQGQYGFDPLQQYGLTAEQLFPGAAPPEPVAPPKWMPADPQTAWQRELQARGQEWMTQQDALRAERQGQLQQMFMTQTPPRMGEYGYMRGDIYGPLRQQVQGVFDIAKAWAPGSENVPGERRSIAQQAQAEEAIRNALMWQVPQYNEQGMIPGRSMRSSQKVWEAWKPVVQQMVLPQTVKGSRPYEEPPPEAKMMYPMPMRQRDWQPWFGQSASSGWRYTPRWG